MTTVKELAFFLIDKQEHYPLSDAFIERYQQRANGYIDFALKTGHPIDQQRHEPNQKWHFFESWLLQKLIGYKTSMIKWDDDAKKAVWTGQTRLKCPELLLWLLEAVGVDSSKVEAAKRIAEDGKEKNVHVNTIASDIRRLIPWEVIEDAMKS